MIAKIYYTPQSRESPKSRGKFMYGKITDRFIKQRKYKNKKEEYMADVIMYNVTPIKPPYNGKIDKYLEKSKCVFNTAFDSSYILEQNLG